MLEATAGRGGRSAGRDLLQLDRLEVGHVAADAPARVELDERLGGVRVDQGGHAEALDDGVAGPEVAERDRQSTGPDGRHVLGLTHRIAQQQRWMATPAGRTTQGLPVAERTSGG